MKEYKTQVSFDQVDLSFLKGFERMLENQGIKTNTIIKHMVSLRQFVNQAIAEKYISSDDNPFRYYKPKTKEKKHKALTLAQVRAIEKYKPPTKHMEKIRDCFLFTCFTGFRYSDIVTLQPDNLNQDKSGQWWINKFSVKTNIESCIPISTLFEGKALDILQKYNMDIRKLVKIGSNGEANADLKTICKATKLDLNFSLSWHVGRHTFGTLLTEQGISINVVSKLLGHTSVRMSETYCETTQTAILNSINQSTVGGKNKKKNNQ